MGGEPQLAPFTLVRQAGCAFVLLLLRLYFKWGAGPPYPLAAQGGQVCQKILSAPVGRCDNFIDKGPACFAKLLRCCVLFGLDVFPRSRWSLYSVAACIFRKPSHPKHCVSEGVWGRPESPHKGACASLSNQTKAVSVQPSQRAFFTAYLPPKDATPKGCGGDRKAPANGAGTSLSIHIKTMSVRPAHK